MESSQPLHGPRLLDSGFPCYTMPMLTLSLVFLSGFIYEALCVFWNDSADKSRALRTGLCAGALALCQIYGIGAAIETIPGAASFILGCTAGGYSSVLFEDRFLSHEGN